MKTQIEQVYDLYISTPSNPKQQYWRTYSKSDNMESAIAHFLSDPKNEGAEIEVKTVWRKYYHY